MNKAFTKHVFVVLAAVALVLMLHGVAAACPTCKDSVSETDPNMVQGYFWSILFMMSMPFLILAGLGAYFYLLIRRSRVQLAARQAAIDELIAASAFNGNSFARSRRVEESIEVGV